MATPPTPPTPTASSADGHPPAVRRPRRLDRSRVPLRGRADQPRPARADRAELRWTTVRPQLGACPGQDQPRGPRGGPGHPAAAVELLRAPQGMEPGQGPGRALVAVRL